VKKYKKYIDWILLVYKYNEKELQDLCTFNIVNKKQIKYENTAKIDSIAEIINELEAKKISKEQLEKIEQILKYKYPHIELSKIPTKASVSTLKEKALEENDESVELENLIQHKSPGTQMVTQFAKPKFLSEQEEKLTGAQKGTLLHLCMQKLDTQKDYSIKDIQDLIEKMKQNNQITQLQAENINVKKVYNFTQSELWKRMKKAKELYKEKAFYINIPISEIYKQDLEGDILVQGIIDLYFIDENDNVVLIDYKTDYIEAGNENTLLLKYRPQLEIYKHALEQALHKQVDEVYIYSTWLDKALQL